MREIANLIIFYFDHLRARILIVGRAHSLSRRLLPTNCTWAAFRPKRFAAFRFRLNGDRYELIWLKFQYRIPGSVAVRIQNQKCFEFLVLIIRIPATRNAGAVAFPESGLPVLTSHSYLWCIPFMSNITSTMRVEIHSYQWIFDYLQLIIEKQVVHYDCSLAATLIAEAEY